MRMTYRQLLKMLSCLSERQLDKEVLLREGPPLRGIGLDFVIPGDKCAKEMGLDINHPLFSYSVFEDFYDDIQLQKYLEAIKEEGGFE